MFHKPSNWLLLRRAGMDRSGYRSAERHGLSAWRGRDDCRIVVNVEERIGYNSAAAGFHQLTDRFDQKGDPK